MSDPPLTFRELEALRKRDEDRLRSENENLSLRMRRSISWGLRGDDALNRDDSDAAFIFYWIAFNAAYGEEREERTEERERERIGRYLARIVGLDSEGIIHRALWVAYSGPVRVLLENKYVYGPFWKHYNGAPNYERWERWFDDERRRAGQALGDGDTLRVLITVFDRLYVLRNQLAHGGATWGSSVNRAQVRDGANLIAFLAPHFIGLMLRNPKEEWGAAYYPVVSD